VLQVVQAQASSLVSARQRTVHDGLRQVSHVILIQPHGTPEGVQDGERDGGLFREDGQVQVAGAGVLRQRLHAHLQRCQQGRVLVTGEEAAEFRQVSARCRRCSARSQLSGFWRTKAPTIASASGR
jgi:hypothetical protein